MATKMSVRGLMALAQSEGLVPTRYRCDAGIDTWGVGHTAAAGSPDPRDMSFRMPDNLEVVIAEAWAVFRKDVQEYTDDVLKHFGSGRELQQNELDGLVNWHFNTGGAAVTAAARRWRNGDKVGAVRILKQWNKVTRRGKKVVAKYLVDRRDLEAAMILRGEYPNKGVPVWPTDGRGNVVWKAIRILPYDDIRAFDAVTQRPAPTPKPRPDPRPTTGFGAVWESFKDLFRW